MLGRDEKAPESMSQAQETMVKNKEGGRILEKIPPSSYVILLAIDGVTRNTPKLRNHCLQLQRQGVDHMTFIIGGSLGLSDEVSQRGKERWSFSSMTFPHQMMRVMLLEQLCRVIGNGG